MSNLDKETFISPLIAAEEHVASEARVLWPCRKLSPFAPKNWGEVEAAFAECPAREMKQHWREAPQGALEPASVRIGWQDEMLWILADLTDQDIFNPASRLNEETYKLGDTFEIFLRDLRLPHYLELHVSPFNQQLQLWFPRAKPANAREWQGRFVSESLFQSWTQVSQSENRWRVLAAVPLPQIAGQESV